MIPKKCMLFLIVGALQLLSYGEVRFKSVGSFGGLSGQGDYLPITKICPDKESPLAVVSPQGNTALWDTSTRRMIRFQTGILRACSQQSKLIAAQSEFNRPLDISVFSRQGIKALSVVSVPTGPWGGMAFSPDGSLFAATNDEAYKCSVVIYETKLWTTVQVVDPKRFVKECRHTNTVQFLPDSRTVVFDVSNVSGSAAQSHLLTYNIESNKHTVLDSDNYGYITDLIVSPDGRFFAYVASPGDAAKMLILNEMPSRKKTKLKYPWEQGAFAFAPDGALFVFSTDEGIDFLSSGVFD